MEKLRSAWVRQKASLWLQDTLARDSFISSSQQNMFQEMRMEWLLSDYSAKWIGRVPLGGCQASNKLPLVHRDYFNICTDHFLWLSIFTNVTLTYVFQSRWKCLTTIEFWLHYRAHKLHKTILNIKALIRYWVSERVASKVCGGGTWQDLFDVLNPYARSVVAGKYPYFKLTRPSTRTDCK